MYITSAPGQSKGLFYKDINAPSPQRTSTPFRLWGVSSAVADSCPVISELYMTIDKSHKPTYPVLSISSLILKNDYWENNNKKQGIENNFLKTLFGILRKLHQNFPSLVTVKGRKEGREKEKKRGGNSFSIRLLKRTFSFIRAPFWGS